MSEIILEACDLVKEYPALRAVDGASLSVSKGEAVFIVGPSGSGKSTFLRCLNHLETATSGKVLFHGKPISSGQKALNRYRAKVGMVFQHFNLFPHLTIRKNITLAPVTTGLLTIKRPMRWQWNCSKGSDWRKKPMLTRCSFPEVRNSASPSSAVWR